MNFALMIVILCLTNRAESVLYPEEYCNGETFMPKCDWNEIVVIEQSSYGRMKLGRCVRRDLGLYKYFIISFYFTRHSSLF